MLALKLVTFACIWRAPWTGLRSPSGHTATASVVYGGLIALFFPRNAAGILTAVLLGGAFGLVFGLSRLALHVHTVPDVLLGAAVGTSAAALLRWLAGDRPATLSSPRLALATLIVIAIFHGHRLQAETHIRWLALDIWPLTLCRP
jgi:membrane-associated phospholipid phosphatase